MKLISYFATIAVLINLPCHIVAFSGNLSPTTSAFTSIHSSSSTSTSTYPSTHPSTHSSTQIYQQSPSFPSFEELSQQKSEALRSLSTTHDGTWINPNGAISFSVTSDVTAGMTKMKRSTSYQTNVSTRLGLDGKNGDALKLVETLSWEQKKKNDNGNNNGNGNGNNAVGTSSSFGNTFFGRSNPLGDAMDIDAVDGSYSLHTYPPSVTNNDDDDDDDDNNTSSCTLPKAITGIDNKIVSSVIEHCLVPNEDERIRCFLLYSKNGLLGQGSNMSYDNGNSNCNDNDNQHEEKLVRVVICHEHRPVVKEGGTDASATNNSNDLLNMAEDKSPPIVVDDDRLDQLASILGTPTVNNEMVNFPISMMSLSLGPWLGDLVIRDKSYNDILPTSSNKSGGGTSSRGFGAPKKISPNKANKRQSGGFGEWVIGVQKAAMQFKWDYGSSVRHCLEFGKSLGCYLEDWPISSSGTIYEERMSRRLKPEDRTMYIDYDMGAYCGFIVGSVYVKAPRLLSFSKAKNGNPIHTEFAAFQKTIDEAPQEEKETWCSRITRTYSADGLLKQGATSFLTLTPIAEPSMDELSP